MASEETVRCPWCCEQIGATVPVCPFCRERLDGRSVNPRKGGGTPSASEEEHRYARHVNQSFVFGVLVTLFGLLFGLVAGPALFLVARQHSRKALRHNFRTRPELKGIRICGAISCVLGLISGGFWIGSTLFPPGEVVEIHLDNGTAQPVRAFVDGLPQAVAASEGRTTFRARAGARRIIARGQDGSTYLDAEVVLAPGRKYLINPDLAYAYSSTSQLYGVSIVFGSGPATKPVTAAVFMDVTDIDYFFQELPSSIQLPPGEMKATRTSLMHHRAPRGTSKAETVESVVSAAKASVPEDRRIVLNVTATTWSGTPLDIAADLREKLRRAGVAVVDEGAAKTDGTLVVTFAEKKGRSYKNLFQEFFGTDMELDLAFGKVNVSIRTSPPEVINGNLREVSEGMLLDHPLYRLVPDLVAASMGVRRSFPELLKATLREETRHKALEVLSAVGFSPVTVRERAFQAMSRGDVERCLEWGRDAVEPLLHAYKVALSRGDVATRDRILDVLVKIGDTGASRDLLERLSTVRDNPGGRGELLKLLLALRTLGDLWAVPELDPLLKSPDSEISGGAAEALAAIRARLRRG